MSDLTDEKYIVFKRDEWEAIVTDKGTATRNEFLRAVVPDAVVIRRQDKFAPPALDAYANAITMVVEALRPLGLDDRAERLQEVADYFHEQAVASWETDRKLPD